MAKSNYSERLSVRDISRKNYGFSEDALSRTRKDIFEQYKTHSAKDVAQLFGVTEGAVRYAVKKVSPKFNKKSFQEYMLGAPEKVVELKKERSYAQSYVERETKEEESWENWYNEGTKSEPSITQALRINTKSAESSVETSKSLDNVIDGRSSFRKAYDHFKSNVIKYAGGLVLAAGLVGAAGCAYSNSAVDSKDGSSGTNTNTVAVVSNNLSKSVSKVDTNMPASILYSSLLKESVEKNSVYDLITSPLLKAAGIEVPLTFTKSTKPNTKEADAKKKLEAEKVAKDKADADLKAKAEIAQREKEIAAAKAAAEKEEVDKLAAAKAQSQTNAPSIFDNMNYSAGGDLDYADSFGASGFVSTRYVGTNLDFQADVGTSEDFKFDATLKAGIKDIDAWGVPVNAYTIGYTGEDYFGADLRAQISLVHGGEKGNETWNLPLNAGIHYYNLAKKGDVGGNVGLEYLVGLGDSPIVFQAGVNGSFGSEESAGEARVGFRWIIGGTAKDVRNYVMNPMSGNSFGLMNQLRENVLDSKEDNKPKPTPTEITGNNGGNKPNDTPDNDDDDDDDDTTTDGGVTDFGDGDNVNRPR